MGEKKHEIKSANRDLKNVVKYLERLKEDLNKLKRHKYNIIDDNYYKGINEIENLFNIDEEEYYEAIKFRESYEGDYIEYESKGDKDKNLLLEEYLSIIRPYLVNMIDNHKAHSEWKIQLIMKTNFISSLDANENLVILVMITDNNNNWHYLAVKSISKLLRGVTSNNNGDFFV